MARKRAKGRLTPDEPAMGATAGQEAFLAKPWVHIGVIVLVSVAVYANTLTMDFVWDDFLQIRENLQIRSLKNIPALFSSDVWKGVKGLYEGTPYYRPLFTLSLAVDYALWKDRPFGYHLTNVILHTLAALMLYATALKLFNERRIALVAALVFTVHPVHADAVAWISARNEPLAALSLLTAFYLYLLYREHEKLWYMAVSFCMFFLSLLSKEMAVTFPVLLLCYGLCLDRKRLKSTVLWSFAYALLTVPYFILRAVILERATWSSYPLLQKVYTGCGLVADYIRLLVAPVNLRVFYDIAIKKTFFDYRVIVPLLVIGAVAASVFALRKDRRLLFSLLWIFIALIPASGFITIILPSPLAERYLYIPSAGFAMACGVLASKTGKQAGAKGSGTMAQGGELPGMRGLALLIVLGVLFVLNFEKNFVYKDRQTFLEHMVKDGPNFYAGHSDLGAVYAEQGKLADAMREFREALKLNPSHHMLYTNLGALYMQMGNYEEARKSFETALKLNPQNWNAHHNLGIIYESQGRDGDAEAEFRAAIALDPEMTDSRYNLGVVLVKREKYDDAAKAFRETLRLDPDHANARYNLAAMYLREGKVDEAVAEFRAAVQLSPDNQMFKKGLERAIGVQSARSRHRGT